MNVIICFLSAGPTSDQCVRAWPPLRLPVSCQLSQREKAADIFALLENTTQIPVFGHRWSEMELFHTSTSTSAPPFSNTIFSSKSILQLYNQEANISFDLFTVSVESIEGTAAENSTFSTPRDTTTGQIFSLNVLDSLV